MTEALAPARPRRLLTWLEPPGSAEVAVRRAAAHQNTRRTVWLTLAVLALNLVHVAIFALAEPTTPLEARWQAGIVWAHGSMAALAAATAALALRARDRDGAPVQRALGVVVTAIALAFTIALAIIDQWVTPSITPFLIGAVVSGTVFLVRPLFAGAVFAVAFVAFWALLPLTQDDPTLLLTNRVNGLTAVVLGLLLSTLWWRKHVASVLLERENAAQQQELREKQAELRYLASRDALTGLFNRHEFTRLVAAELARARRYETPTCLVVFDLDEFKHVNDAHGHPVGDAVLVHVARVVDATVRASDLVARIGGEEFVVLLPQTGGDAGRELAERLRAALATTPLPHAGHAITVTASFGVACAAPGVDASFDGLYSAADKALYGAKRAGRDRVHVATGTPSIEAPGTHRGGRIT